MERDMLVRDCHQRPLGSERVRLAFWKQQALGAQRRLLSVCRTRMKVGVELDTGLYLITEFHHNSVQLREPASS